MEKVVSKKHVPSPQEEEQRHEDDMKDLRNQINHSEKVLGDNSELPVKPELLLDNEKKGGL